MHSVVMLFIWKYEVGRVFSLNKQRQTTKAVNSCRKSLIRPPDNSLMFYRWTFYCQQTSDRLHGGAAHC